ncbi:MAG: YdcF family protein [Clostridia bacterium]|nr:YdcF family protein [Clostridia bacterium]
MKRHIIYISIIAIFIASALFFKLALTGYSFLSLVLFALALIVSAFYLLSFKKTRTFSVLRKLLTGFTALVTLLVIIALIPVISCLNKKEKASSPYVIVLGAGVHGTTPSRVLRQRIDAAYDFLTKHPEAIAILSGGKGDGEDISEAQCMKNELIKKGISPNRLIMEDRSTSTEENVRFSKEILSKIAPEQKSVTVISSDTHMYRASLILRKNGFEPSLYSAYTDYPILRFSYMLRESVAVWVEWLF